MENYSASCWDWMHPARSLLDHGIPMAAHSDDPVSVADPLLRIQDMVTRTSAEGKVYGAKQRVTAQEALRAWTIGGAYGSFENTAKAPSPRQTSRLRHALRSTPLASPPMPNRRPKNRPWRQNRFRG
jgi:hypothetical protein